MKLLFCGYTQMSPRYSIYFCPDDEDHGDFAYKMDELLEARDALNKFIEQQKDKE